MDLDKLQYFPLALPHFSLLALIFIALVAWIEVRALRSAYLSMGLGPHAALLLLLASLAGSYLNIPVASLPGEQIVSGREIWYFGMHYVIPEVVSRPGTLIAVNVGGALIPGLLSILPSRTALHCSGSAAANWSTKRGSAIGSKCRSDITRTCPAIAGATSCPLAGPQSCNASHTAAP